MEVGRGSLTGASAVHVVREGKHERDSAQLSDARTVRAVRGRGLRHGALSRPARLRPSHLRLLRRRDGRQDDGDGCGRQEGLPRRDMEPPRHVHCPRRVRYHVFRLYIGTAVLRILMFNL